MIGSYFKEDSISHTLISKQENISRQKRLELHPETSDHCRRKDHIFQYTEVPQQSAPSFGVGGGIQGKLDCTGDYTDWENLVKTENVIKAKGQK